MMLQNITIHSRLLKLQHKIKLAHGQNLEKISVFELQNSENANYQCVLSEKIFNLFLNKKTRKYLDLKSCN